MFNREDFKQILISIIVGAVVAFLTTFLEGLLTYLRGMENNILGGTAATVYNYTKWRTNRTA